MTFSFPTVAHKNEQQDIIVYHNMDSNAQNSQVYPVNGNLLQQKKESFIVTIYSLCHTLHDQIISKKRVLSLLSAIATKFFTGKKAQAVIVNNESGVLVLKDEEVVGVFSFTWKKNTNQIEQIYYVVNPDKLGHIIIQR